MNDRTTAKAADTGEAEPLPGGRARPKTGKSEQTRALILATAMRLFQDFILPTIGKTPLPTAPKPPAPTSRRKRRA